MPDSLGWRKKFAVLIPSTNTIVEPQYHMMSVPGVTVHTGRVYVSNPDTSSGAAFRSMLDQLKADMESAITRVASAEPDYFVMGLATDALENGVEGNREIVKLIKDRTGLDTAMSAQAVQRALNHYNVKRIGVLTPYNEATNKNVIQFFDDLGFEVPSIKALNFPNAIAFAHEPEESVRSALAEVNSDKVEAVVQSGTNVNTVRLADEAERWLGKPVITYNAATWWMALRENGIEDKLYGFGRLLREF